MTDRSTILRARICRELVARSPRGMTANQIRQYVATPQWGCDLPEILETMVRDDLAVLALEPRRVPGDPLRVYIASRRLMAGR